MLCIPRSAEPQSSTDKTAKNVAVSTSWKMHQAVFTSSLYVLPTGDR